MVPAVETTVHRSSPGRGSRGSAAFAGRAPARGRAGVGGGRAGRPGWLSRSGRVAVTAAVPGAAGRRSARPLVERDARSARGSSSTGTARLPRSELTAWVCGMTSGSADAGRRRRWARGGLLGRHVAPAATSTGPRSPVFGGSVGARVSLRRRRLLGRLRGLRLDRRRRRPAARSNSLRVAPLFWIGRKPPGSSPLPAPAFWPSVVAVRMNSATFRRPPGPGCGAWPRCRRPSCRGRPCRDLRTSAWSSTYGRPRSARGSGSPAALAPLVRPASPLSPLPLPAACGCIRSTAAAQRVLVGRDEGALLGLQRRGVQAVAGRVAEADHAEHEAGAVGLPVDPAQLVGLVTWSKSQRVCTLGQPSSSASETLRSVRDRGRELGEVDVGVGLPAGVLGRRDVGVQQRPLRARQLDLLVAGLTFIPHGSALPLMKSIASWSWAIQSVSCSMMSESLASDSSAAPASWAFWLEPGVERDELGVVHDRDRVVLRCPGWPRPSVGAEVGLGQQLGHQPRIQPQVGVLARRCRVGRRCSRSRSRSPPSARSRPGRRWSAGAARRRTPRRRPPLSIRFQPAASDIWLSWNLNRFLSRQYAGDHCSAAWAISSEP